MGRYLSLWEIDSSKLPADPKEQFELFNRLQNMVKEDIKNGKIIGFGMFLDGYSGYAIDEGTEEEVALLVMKYYPFVKCKLQQVISTDQMDGIMKKFANM